MACRMTEVSRANGDHGFSEGYPPGQATPVLALGENTKASSQVRFSFLALALLGEPYGEFSAGSDLDNSVGTL